jgi:drug/metabolite transporter (DMT)-like permease
MFGSLVLIMLRRIGQYESPVTSAIWYNGTGAVLFVALQLAFDLPLPDVGRDVLALVALGVIASVQQIALSTSHRFAPASTLATLRYLSIPLGMIAGMVFFDEVVTGQFILGSSIVIAASIFIIYRERVTSGVNRHAPDKTSRK